MTLILSSEAIEEIGEKLRKIREGKNLTQLDVAKKAKISASYYARVERGVEKPSLAFIEVITKALNIRSSDILPF